jgi:hypothetical protein
MTQVAGHISCGVAAVMHTLSRTCALHFATTANLLWPRVFCSRVGTLATHKRQQQQSDAAQLELVVSEQLYGVVESMGVLRSRAPDVQTDSLLLAFRCVKAQAQLGRAGHDMAGQGRAGQGRAAGQVRATLVCPGLREAPLSPDQACQAHVEPFAVLAPGCTHGTSSVEGACICTCIHTHLCAA